MYLFIQRIQDLKKSMSVVLHVIKNHAIYINFSFDFLDFSRYFKLLRQ